MKKLFTVLALALVTLTISAQDFKKFRFGPTVGLNVSTVTDNGGGSNKIGFNAGVRGEYNFSNHWFATLGLGISQKGFKDAGGEKAKPYYLEIPIKGGYRYSFNDDFSLFGEFGPYMAIGIAGKYYDTKIFSADGWDNKKFDFGLGIGVGAEYKKFQLRIGYDFGLLKTTDWATSKNRNLYINLGYMF